MKIRATKRLRQECSQAIRQMIPENGASVSVGSYYAAQAIAVFEGMVFLQIVDDLNAPSWLPGDLFELADKSIPNDWQCNILPAGDSTGATMLLGPDFIVDSGSAYSAMVSLEDEQIQRFWKRIGNLCSEDSQ